MLTDTDPSQTHFFNNLVGGRAVAAKGQTLPPHELQLFPFIKKSVQPCKHSRLKVVAIAKPTARQTHSNIMAALIQSRFFPVAISHVFGHYTTAAGGRSAIRPLAFVPCPSHLFHSYTHSLQVKLHFVTLYL